MTGPSSAKQVTPTATPVSSEGRELAGGTANERSLPPPVARAPFYRPELDGLRFFAFFAVFLHHALPIDAAIWLQHGAPTWAAGGLAAATLAGGFGVDLFFVLSAYLITGLLLKERAEFGSLHPGKFLARRALRIWPLYFAFLVLCSGLIPIVRSSLNHRELTAFALFVANWQIVFAGYPKSIAAPLWSVSIEEQFYVVWPWFVRKGSVTRLVVSCGLLILIALATRAVLASWHSPHTALWCNTFARLDPIALGAIVAALEHRYGLGRSVRATTFGCVVCASVTLTVLVTWLILRVSPNLISSWWMVPSYLVVAVACSAVLVSVLHLPSNVAKVLGSSPLVYLGRISYGLYVFHVLAIQRARGLASKIPALAGFVGITVVGLVITVGLASASYFILEKPFLRLKRKFSRVESRPD